MLASDVPRQNLSVLFRVIYIFYIFFKDIWKTSVSRDSLCNNSAGLDSYTVNVARFFDKDCRWKKRFNMQMRRETRSTCQLPPYHKINVQMTCTPSLAPYCAPLDLPLTKRSALYVMCCDPPLIRCCGASFAFCPRMVWPYRMAFSLLSSLSMG